MGGSLTCCGDRLKYMGSKAGMLAGTLGEQLRTLAPKHERFVDLFSGSGAVARYVATTLSSRS
jgi:adenine-specific DNA-methyltransferase